MHVVTTQCCQQLPAMTRTLSLLFQLYFWLTHSSNWEPLLVGTGTELCGHASGCTAMTDPASTGPPLVQGKRCAPLTGGEAEAWRRGLFRAAGLPSCFTQGSVTQGLFLSQRLLTCQGNLGKDPSSGRKWPDLLRQDSESTPPKCAPLLGSLLPP